MSRSLAAALAITDLLFLPNLAPVAWPFAFLPGLDCDLAGPGQGEAV